MTEKKFKIGDVVQLKSGGPLMTICGINEFEYNCTWFQNNETRTIDSFEEDILELSQYS